MMQWFSYLDKREVLQQEYFQPPIRPSPHFWWVVNTEASLCIQYEQLKGRHTFTYYDLNDFTNNLEDKVYMHYSMHLWIDVGKG